MEINIPLPHDFSINTYKELRTYLKQLELAVHYAQKVVENAEKDGVQITEDAHVCFDHPSLEEDSRSNMYEELQNVSLQIYLN